MTKKEFEEDFVQDDLYVVALAYELDGIPDKIARRCAYNDKLDIYMKNGIVTEMDSENWYITKELETTVFYSQEKLLKDLLKK